MADVNFIEFYASLSEALTERTSPQINMYEVRGIQLLPNNPLPYIQTTNVNGGIELEDWTVYIVNTWDSSETDITAYFVIEEIFIDENGYNQFTWSLKNIPFDFGNRMVYLKANQTIGETFYSNMFQLTENSSEKTTRIDYKSYNKDTMQSTQLKMWYWQPLKNQEITLYYERSTKNTVENTVKSQKYELWLTEVMSSSLFMKLSDILEYKYKYFNLVRTRLFENIDQKEHTGRRNSERYPLKLSFNHSDIYDPLAVEAVIPLVPEINLVSVITSTNTAYYYFNFANFTPTYFILEYSDDQVNWTTATQVYDTASPKAILFDEVGTWYFRMRHPEAVSNIFTLELGETVIANDDTLTIAKGGVSEIDVLFNDSLVGDTTIISVSTATNGIVEIIESGTKIRYTHDDSSSVSDSFTYTISNGITSDTATVEMTIVPLGIVGMWFVGASTKPNACSLYVDEFVDFYYSGGGVVPTIDSVIYSITSEGYAPFNGHGLWYQITGARVIRIDENGVVTGKSIC